MINKVVIVRRTTRTTISSTASAIQLARDRVRDTTQLLLLLIKLLRLGRVCVLLQPIHRLLDRLHDRLLVVLIDLAAEAVVIVDLVLEAEGVVFEAVARFDLVLGGLVFFGVLFGFGDHALDFVGGETAAVVGDGDGFGLASAFVGFVGKTCVSDFVMLTLEKR